MELITFNTGRLYSPEGQRIVAEIHENHVYFWDLGRCIGGRINTTIPAWFSTKQKTNKIMQEYDNNRYDGEISCLSLARHWKECPY